LELRGSHVVDLRDDAEEVEPRVAPAPRWHRLILGADVVGGAAAGVAAAAVADVTAGWVVAVVAGFAAAWPSLTYLCGLQSCTKLQVWASGVDEAPRLLVCGLLVSWPALGGFDLLNVPHPVRGALVGAAVAVVAGGTARALARLRLHSLSAFRQRVLLIGSGHVAAQLVARMRRHGEYGLEPIGFVDDEPDGSTAVGIPRLGRLDALPRLVERERPDRVVIAFTRADHEQLLGCLHVCRAAGITVDVVPRLFEFLDDTNGLEHLGGFPLLAVGPPSFSRLAHASKRALDLLGAAGALLALAPVLAAIAVAIRVDSQGPVLFRQRRSGRGGSEFTLYKFRSMAADAEVLTHASGSIVKLRADERVTRVGRLIRRFSLDEAPQLVNVLRGDMSLVGPRPLVLAEQAALAEAWQYRRADLRPGLTGPWQVRGRSHIAFEDMIRLDYQYVAGWSLARDLKILLATVPAVLSGRGAY
jgi:exopolysaccharide biosynthesis polyprenyl glycosylphosphotransferase